jgi:prolyl 4-hydroxylase
LLETIEGFYSVPECEYLIASASQYLQRSVVVEADGRLVPHPDRASSDTSLRGVLADFAVRWLERRMTDWLELPLRNAEDLVILRYGPGEEYRPHYDFLPPDGFGNRSDAASAGQRIHTLFCYLDDVAEGGATVFPRLGLQIRPRRGRVVHFVNVDATGAGDPRTLHGGAPVLAGEKWLATLWTRERAFRDY